jgi:hypothetical protein
MRIVPGMSGIDLGVDLWRRARPDLGASATRWFVRSFVNAATVVVEQWGPSWSKKRIGSSCSVGACALLVLWLALPVLLVSWLW